MSILLGWPRLQAYELGHTLEQRHRDEAPCHSRLDSRRLFPADFVGWENGFVPAWELFAVLDG